MASDEPITMRTWRGCPCLDFNMLLLFAHAPLDQAADAFAKTFDAKSRTKDVIGKSVKAKPPAYLAYQFAGHAWSVFDLLTSLSGHPNPKPDAAEKLSKTLGGRAMLLKVSDTAGYYEYALFDAGKLVQRYCDVEGELHFESADKSVARPTGGDVTAYFDGFAKSQDLLIPPFGSMSSWFDIPMGSKASFELEVDEEDEFNADDIVRADVICLA